MRCEYCGKEGVRLRHLTQSLGKGESLLVIENVPVLTCSHCGESYMTAQTLHQIERIRRIRHGFAKSRQVEVANFVG